MILIEIGIYIVAFAVMVGAVKILKDFVIELDRHPANLWPDGAREKQPPQAPGLDSDRQRLETLVRFDEYRRRIL